MVDPLFGLGLSILLLAISLTVVLVVALPALRELGRAARSAEKLFDTLNRELPPTLEAIRLTGIEMSELSDDMSEGVQSAGQLVKQVEQGLSTTRQQAQKVQTASRSFLAGAKAAWKTFTRKPSSRRRNRERHLSATNRSSIELEDRQNHSHSAKRSPKGWEETSQKNLGESLLKSANRLTSYRKNGQAAEYMHEIPPSRLELTAQSEALEANGDKSAPESNETAPI